MRVLDTDELVRRGTVTCSDCDGTGLVELRRPFRRANQAATALKPCRECGGLGEVAQ